MPSIVFLESLGVPWSAVESAAGDLDPPHELVPDAAAHAEDVHILVTVRQPVDANCLERYPKVRMVSVAFTGYDCVDLALCRRDRIAVYNVPDYSTDSVVELAVGLAIATLRRIPEGDHGMRLDGWTTMPPGIELAGKTVGIVGLGAIGLRAAGVFRALRCNVIGTSRREKETFDGTFYPWALRAKVFAEADVVTIHVAANDETRGVVDRSLIRAMKPGAILVNTSRGAVVDQDALSDALVERRIRGAALDVFRTEAPVPLGERVLQLGNTVLTPHIAYKTEEALARRAEIAIANICDFLEGKATNRVDP